jgi:hypothetical protein
MLDFQKISQQEASELQSIISKNIEKTELERYYLYTQDPVEKAKIFIWCHRFLYSINNISKDCNLRTWIQEEIEKTESTYQEISNLLYKIERFHFNRTKYTQRMWNILLSRKEVDDLID